MARKRVRSKQRVAESVAKVPIVQQCKDEAQTLFY